MESFSKEKLEAIVSGLHRFPKSLIAAYTLDSIFTNACEKAAEYIESVISPMSVQELQAMDVGDCVWIDFLLCSSPSDKRSANYLKHDFSTDSDFWGSTLNLVTRFDYKTYGKDWVAYRRKLAD